MEGIEEFLYTNMGELATVDGNYGSPIANTTKP